MANFYCEYCGFRFPTIQALTGTSCYHHPAGWNKGKHKLYEGSENPNTLANIVEPSFLLCKHFAEQRVLGIQMEWEKGNTHRRCKKFVAMS
jgi:hypothetical protein